jgi:hypothetical protein
MVPQEPMRLAVLGKPGRRPLQASHTETVESHDASQAKTQLPGREPEPTNPLGYEKTSGEILVYFEMLWSAPHIQKSVGKGECDRD